MQCYRQLNPSHTRERERERERDGGNLRIFSFYCVNVCLNIKIATKNASKKGDLESTDASERQPHSH